MSLLLVLCGVIGFSTLLFWALPELMRRAPASMINIPNKEYWLSPERRTLATHKFAVWSSTFGAAVNLLMVTLQLALRTPAGSPPVVPTLVPGFALGGFFVFTLCSLIWLVAAYRIPARTG